jgi:hypothetical protein
MMFARITTAVVSAVALSSPAWAATDQVASVRCTADLGQMKKLETRATQASVTTEPAKSGQTLAALKKLDGNTIGTQIGTGPSQDVPLGARILTRDMPAGGPGRDIQGSCF